MLLTLSVFLRFHNAFNSEATLKLPVSENVYYRNVTLNSGYVLATHFSDQMTGSLVNVMSLQCWVSTLSGEVRVVEPFIHDKTVLGFSLNSFQHNSGYLRSDVEDIAENKIKLSDVFNKDQLNRIQSSQKIAPFVSWDYFIEHGPSSLIIVDQSKWSHSGPGLSASYDSDNFLRKAKQFARYYNFHLVRTVNYHHKLYSQINFTKLVYGPYKPQDTVVIFNHFGGIVTYSDRYRVLIDSQKCGRNNFFYFIRKLQGSPLVNNMSSTYIQKFLSSSKNFIGIMLRLEYMIRKSYFVHKTIDKQKEDLRVYLDYILEKINSLKKKSNISELFLTTDIGKYGSTSFNFDTNNNIVIREGIERFYRLLFNDTATEEEMYKRIEDIVKFPVPGLVAQIEKIIAANSTCLVLAGGGAYQDSSLKLYKHFSRQKKQERCITDIYHNMF